MGRENAAVERIPVTQKTWAGAQKIVIALDVGTTNSGVAYSYLYPGGKVNVQRVIHWPGQELQKGDAKIPTAVWYDRAHNPRAFGAEAMTNKIRQQAEDEGWELAEHFKLHLHPTTMRAESDIVVQPLPKGVELDQIYADFFRYLYQHTRDFFQQREMDGKELWDKLESTTEVVIAHPNGWSTYEQGFLRHAAVKGGLVPEGSAAKRVLPVTEGEASVHFVMAHGSIDHRFQRGTSFVLCDAGGSTVDTTVYRVEQTSPTLELTERRASACVQAGAVFVNQSARVYFDGLLRSAGYDVDDVEVYTQEAVESFEVEGKKGFERADAGDVGIKVGTHRLTERKINVRRGLMSVPGAEVEKFFSPWVGHILKSVEEQMSGWDVSHIFLVGGFGDSPYLRRRFQECSSFKDVEITQLNDLSSKAVAVGAALWHLQKTVTARAARFSYGNPTSQPYNRNNSQHIGRTIVQDLDGPRVSGTWCVVARKGDVINMDGVRRVYNIKSMYSSPDSDLTNYSINLYARTSSGDTEPYFLWDPSGHAKPEFSFACTITADLSGLRDSLRERVGPSGRAYWELYYDVGILAGAIELTAMILWKDQQGVEHRSEASVIPQRFT